MRTLIMTLLVSFIIGCGQVDQPNSSDDNIQQVMQQMDSIRFKEKLIQHMQMTTGLSYQQASDTIDSIYVREARNK